MKSDDQIAAEKAVSDLFLMPRTDEQGVELFLAGCAHKEKTHVPKAKCEKLVEALRLYANGGASHGYTYAINIAKEALADFETESAE